MKKHFLSIFALALSIMLILTGCQAESVPVASIILEKTEIDLLLGSSEKLTYTTAPAEATTGLSVTWSTDNADIVSVDQEGNITAKAVGEAAVTVTTEAGLKSSCKVTVNPILTDGITLNKTSIELFVGETETLTYVIRPENTTDKTVTWESSVPEVASVADGQITALTVGETVITVKATNGKTATCNVKVNPIVATGISFEKSTLLKENKCEPFKVKLVINPENTTDKAVTWSSSDEKTATVNAEGLITPIKAGTAVIKATLGKLEAEFTLEIVDVISETGKLTAMLEEKGLNEATSLRIAGSLDKFDYYALYEHKTLVDLDLKLTDSEDMIYINPRLEKLILPAKTKEIEAYKFYFNTVLKSVELPEGLKTIGDYAFWNSGITEITIPSTVETFGVYPFYGANALTSVTFAEGTKKTSNWLLAENPDVTSITLPSTLEEIGIGTFSGTGITEIVIPDSVTTISQSAFEACPNLTSITIPAGVTAIPANMCANTTNLNSITYKGNNIKTIGYCSFTGTALTEIKIPASVETIEAGAFQFCKNVTKVEFPDTASSKIKTIGDNAFRGLKITELILPDTVETIGSGAFTECNDLTTVHLSEKVRILKNSCFQTCKKLTTINLPDTIERIEQSAFHTQSHLIFPDNTLTLPANLEEIGETAFTHDHIEKVVFNDKLRIIHACPFSPTGKITEIAIPATVETMTDYWPQKITKVTFKGIKPPEMVPIKSSGPEYRKWMESATVYIPEAAVEDYKRSQWFTGDLPHFDPKNIVTVPEV